MFARLVRFSFGPGKSQEAQAFANEMVPLINSQPGCDGTTVFGDAADGECGIFVLWDTQEHADAAAELVRPRLDAHLAGKVQGPPDARLFPVIDPN